MHYNRIIYKIISSESRKLRTNKMLCNIEIKVYPKFIHHGDTGTASSVVHFRFALRYFQKRQNSQICRFRAYYFWSKALQLWTGTGPNPQSPTINIHVRVQCVSSLIASEAERRRNVFIGHLISHLWHWSLFLLCTV